MPHPVAEAISYARAAIAEVAKHEEYLNNLPDIRKANLALCETYAKQLSDKTDATRAAQAELDKNSAQLKKGRAILLDQRTRAENDIDAQIATAQATLADLEGKVTAKRQALAQIDASKQALARRLDLGQGTQH